MYKVANQVVDAYDDIYWEQLQKIAEEKPHLNMLTADELSKLRDDDFALCFITKEAQKLRKFPVNDADNTYLSNRYFENTHHKVGMAASIVAASNIKEACSRFGITPCASVVKLASSVENNIVREAKPLVPKQVETTVNLEKFAEVDKITGNYTHAQYVFNSPASIKVACQYFEEKHEKMSPDVRHKYASAIQLRAKELGMQEQGGMVSKYAGSTYGRDVDAHIASRRRLLDGNPFGDEISKIASAKAQYTPSQFAQILHGFDKKAGLTRHYGGYLTDPYQAVFASQPETTSGYEWMDKKGSRKLTEAEIQAVVKNHSSKIAEYFGTGVAKEMMRDPVAIFQSLPNDAKEIIGNISDGSL